MILPHPISLHLVVHIANKKLSIFEVNITQKFYILSISYNNFFHKKIIKFSWKKQ